MKKTIQEQLKTDTNRDLLIKANKLGCFPSWLKNGQIGTIGEKKVFYGTNSKNETIVFYTDMTAENQKTKEKRRWECKELQETVSTTSDVTNLTEDQNKYIEDMKKYSAVQTEKPSDFETTNLGKFQKIDLNLLSPTLFPEKNKYFVYSQSNLANIKRNQYIEVEKLLNDAGYTLTEPSATTPEFQMGRNVETILKGLSNGFLSDMFKGKGIKSYPKTTDVEKGEGRDLTKSSKEEFEKMKVNRRDCQSVIKYLYKNSKKGVTLIPNQANHLKMQDLAYRCATQGMNFLEGVTGIQDEITYLKNDSGSYGLNKFFRKSMKENEEKKLSNLVKTNLMEISQNKKKMINEEKKIISTRFTLLSENVNIKTKKGKDNFCNDLLNEVLYLNSQGFDKQIIEEGFFDIISGIFGKSGDAVLQTFKEYVAKWLIKNLTPLDPQGWIAGIIVKSIGNVNLTEIPKLISDCNFLSKTLSKAVVEESIDRMKNMAGLEGEFYNVLRNAIVQSLEDTDLGKKVETSLGSFICPLLGGVKQKMEVAADTMKEKVMA